MDAELNPEEPQTITRLYVRSIYYAFVTLTTTGYGDIKAHTASESVFSGLTVLFGGFLYYGALGAISSMLANASAVERDYQEKIDMVYAFIKLHHLGPVLSNRIRLYYNYLWFRQRGVKEETILADLPVSLSEDIGCALNLNIIKESILFAGCSTSLLKSLTAKFQYHIYLPGDYISRAHDVATEMFILNRGRAAILSSNMKVYYGFLSSGDCYGQALFLMQLRRKFHVKTLMFCDVSVLDISDFQDVFREYPGDRNKIRSNSIKVGGAGCCSFYARVRLRLRGAHHVCARARAHTHTHTHTHTTHTHTHTHTHTQEYKTTKLPARQDLSNSA